MALTIIGWISILLNVLFLAALTWLIIEYFKAKNQVKRLAGELESDSLEFYLNEIKKRGFDFTLKPKEKKGK